MFVRATHLRFIHLPASMDPAVVLQAARECVPTPQFAQGFFRPVTYSLSRAVVTPTPSPDGAGGRSPRGCTTHDRRQLGSTSQPGVGWSQQDHPHRALWWTDGAGGAEGWAAELGEEIYKGTTWRLCARCRCRCKLAGGTLEVTQRAAAKNLRCNGKPWEEAPAWQMLLAMQQLGCLQRGGLSSLICCSSSLFPDG